ncbi:MAG: hypothetical protein PHS57_07130 [Alphaproteobacteria bacterium]|nr:hypothetical protein [Alphaproteobacteria bacterium]
MNLLAAASVLVLAAYPAGAKPAVAATNNLTQIIVSESPAPLDPSLALATSSVSNDGLANFGPSSGTVVGDRAQALRDEVLKLRASVNLNSNEFAILRTSGTAGAVQYHSAVAAITARLQNGTTKGNPILLRQWEEADACLSEVTTSLNRLNSLQIAVDADASVASYLLGSIQAAYDLSGAVDEDHDQLKMLHDEVSRLVVQLDYLRNQTTADIQRQSNYLTTERANLQALAFAISRGELLGNSLSNRPVVVNPPPVMTVSINERTSQPQAAPASLVSEEDLDETIDVSETTAAGDIPSVGHLLVLIRFNQPDVDYEQQLAQAVNVALERRPNATFSIVAVTPASGDSATIVEQQQIAKSKADEVNRALIKLGLPPSKITQTRMQDKTAQSPEVHVYIR